MDKRILFLICAMMLLVASNANAWWWSSGTTAPVAETRETKTYGPNGMLLKEEKTAKATGPASKGLSDFKAGNLDLNETSITIGGVSYKVKLPARANTILMWAGVAFIAVGVLLFGWFMKQWTLAAISAMLGVSIIGLAYYPWLAGVAAGLAILSGVGYLIWKMHKGRWDHNTLRALISSMRESSDESEAAVLTRFKAKAKHTNGLMKTFDATEKKMSGP